MGDTKPMRHAKGVSLIGLVKFLRAKQREKPLVGLSRGAEALLSQRILFTSWYPLEHLVAMLDYTYEGFLGGREAAGIAMGAAGGKEVWRSTHRALLRGGDPTRDLRVMVPAWSQYFDFGSLELTTARETELRFCVHGYEDMGPSHGTTIAGWHLAAAQLSGWSDARVQLIDRPWRGAATLTYLVHKR